MGGILLSYSDFHEIYDQAKIKQGGDTTKAAKPPKPPTSRSDDYGNTQS